MAIARAGQGRAQAVAALASQVHPVFMLPPVAVSLFGAVLATDPDPVAAALHVTAIFFAMYVAHVKDGYVDFYARGEDDDHPLTEMGCHLGLAGATAGFVLATVGLLVVANPLAVLLTIPGWVIGYLHAPYLDMAPVTATVDYPVGIGLALLGSYAAHAGTLGTTPLAFAVVLVVVLSGVKVIDDAQDVDWDREYGKRTVAVVLGPARARTVSYALMALGGFLVLAFAGVGIIPDGAAIGVFVFAAVAAIAAEVEAERATMLLVRGAYLFLAFLVVAVWYRPLAGSPPFGQVLGPYLYLGFEVGFGLVALGLLSWTGSLWAAAKTIAVLYPLAFVWDWYSIEVGIFAILRTSGIEVVGIPLEEHLFMIVVPAFVIGVHEARRSGWRTS